MVAANTKQNLTSFRLGTVYLLVLGPMILALFSDRGGLPFLMLVLAAIIYWTRRNSERPYTVWAILPLAVSGFALSALRPPPRAREYLAILAGGAWLLFQGVLTLNRYLRAHRS